VKWFYIRNSTSYIFRLCNRATSTYTTRGCGAEHVEALKITLDQSLVDAKLESYEELLDYIEEILKITTGNPIIDTINNKSNKLFELDLSNTGLS
jgi:hypothetical protein